MLWCTCEKSLGCARLGTRRSWNFFFILLWMSLGSEGAQILFNKVKESSIADLRWQVCVLECALYQHDGRWSDIHLLSKSLVHVWWSSFDIAHFWLVIFYHAAEICWSRTELSILLLAKVNISMYLLNINEIMKPGYNYDLLVQLIHGCCWFDEV